MAIPSAPLHYSDMITRMNIKNKHEIDNEKNKEKSFSSWSVYVQSAAEATRHFGKRMIEYEAPYDKRRPAYEEFGMDPRFNPFHFAHSFLSRTRVSSLTCLLGFYYIDKLLRRNSENEWNKRVDMRLTTNNASRMVFVSCMCAAKYYDDQAMEYSNFHW